MTDFKEAVRDASPIEEIAEKYTHLKKNSSKTLVGLCPLVEEKTPSFTVYPKTQSFHCFGCGAGGDVFKLVELKEGVDFERALELLANKAGIDKNISPLPPSVKPVTVLPSSSEGHKAKTPDVTGVTLEQIAAAKKLPIDFLKSLGCSDIKKNGKPAVKVPYFNRLGELAAVRYRTALEGKRRFEWRQSDRAGLYGLDRLKDICATGWVLLVEGESDCWTAWHHGIPALGIPGKTIWRPAWAKLIENVEVYLWLEPGADDLVERVAKDIPALKVVSAFDRAKDISDGHVNGLDVSKLIDDLRAKARSATDIFAERQCAEIDELRLKAAPVLAAKNPLALIAGAIRSMGYGGNIGRPLLVYLAATSRLLAMRPGSMPVHLLLMGQTSAGKSYLMGIILKLLPETGHHTIDAGSPRNLIYDKAELKHKVLVFGEADSLPAGEDNPAASAVRNLLQEHRLNYDVTERDPETGGFTVRQIRKDGPTVLFTTSTRPLGAQLGSRVFTLDVPDDQNQIRSALKTQAYIELHGVSTVEDALPAYQAVLQAAAPWEVIVPFADQLADNIGKSPCASRILRDYARLLSLIKAVAVINYARRRRDASGRLVAEIRDYGVVYGLIKDVYAASVTGAGAGVRQAVEAVKALRDAGKEQVRIVDVATKLEQSKMSVSRRVKAAIKGGWLVNPAPKGCPADLNIGDELPANEGLPKPSSLSGNTVTKRVSSGTLLDQGGNTVTPLTAGNNGETFSGDNVELLKEIFGAVEVSAADLPNGSPWPEEPAGPDGKQIDLLGDVPF